MVYWAEIVGNTIDIPSVIMGLTVLTGGTSLLDNLTTVIVAKKGHGDMALASSIGSNIFDILVGLAVPRILYTAWPTTADVVSVGSEGTLVSLFLLLGTLVFIVVVVHCQGWKLTKTLGFLTMLFYIGYLVQAIVLELPFEICK
jgi:sodium/potassium/calcium exchanger 2